MKKVWLTVYVAIVAMTRLLMYCLSSLGDGQLHVFMLDIGQGDAILVQTPAMERILIDGGPNDKVLRELAEVIPFYERSIDLLILSHPHADHLNGLIEVLKRYNVKQIMITGVVYHYAGYSAFLDLVAEKKINVILVNGKNDYRVGNGGVTLDILFPFESLQGRSFENLNNSSITFRLLYGKNIFYFSGDLEVEGERKLVVSDLDLRADFFKAGHHGSRTSSSEALLDLVQPNITFISCGVNNKFKHPHPETIQHFQERGMQIFRTDIHGRIEVVSDGKSLKVQSIHKDI